MSENPYYNGRTPLRQFTSNIVAKNRQLVFDLLRYVTDIVMNPETRQNYYVDQLETKVTFRPEQRIVGDALMTFGFDNSPGSMRTFFVGILSVYYRSPTDCDRELLDQLVWFKLNRLLWYTSPVIKRGYQMPNFSIHRLSGESSNFYEMVSGLRKTHVFVNFGSSS